MTLHDSVDGSQVHIENDGLVALDRSDEDASVLDDTALLDRTRVWVDDSDDLETSTGYCIRELKREILRHPNVVEVDDPGRADLIHLNSLPFQRSDFRILLSRSINAPVICTHHGGYLWWEENRRLLRERPIFLVKQFLYRLGQYGVNCVSFSTEYTRSLAVERGGIDPDLTTVTPLGRNEDYRNVGPTNTDNPFVLLPINHSNRRKNIPTILRTMRQIPDVRFLLCGNGWNDIASERLPANADHLGWITEDELIDHYNRATAVYLPTLFEGFGLPYIEAMGCGTAVLVAEIPAAKEVCGDAAVYLSDPMDPQEHADRIRHLISDDDYRQKKEREGERVAARYSWTRTAEQYVRLYTDLLSGR